MRIPALLLSSLFLLPAAPVLYAQDAGGQGDGVQIVASSDWDRVLALYKHSQGGAERFDGLRTISFDFTPAIVNEEGEEVKASMRHMTVLMRPDADEQEVRTVRIESEIAVPGSAEGETIKTVSLVTSQSVLVWAQGEDGEYTPVEARELKAAAVFDAKSIWAQLDLILYPDHPDLRCTFSGVMTRDSKRYAAVEAEFRPGRQVPEPARLYFSAVSSLVERIDVFDPKTHLRTGTTYLEEYKDHDGVKVPHYFRFIDRRARPLGSWRLDDLKLNPTLPDKAFTKP